MALGIANSSVAGRTRRSCALAGVLLAAMLPAAAHAQQSLLQISTPVFPLTAVGQSVTQNVTITVAPGGNQVIFNSIQLAPGVSDFTLGAITGCVVDGSTINTDGATCTIPVTFTPTLPGNAGAPQPIARAAALQITDIENYVQQSYSLGLVGSATMPRAVIVPGTINDLVGNDQSPTSGFGGDYGPASGAVFNAPTNMAVDSMGNIYIADTANCVVRVVNKSTQTISTFAGVAPSPTPNCGPGTDGTYPTASQLNQPTGVAVDAGGNVYIADTGNGAVRMVNPVSNFITTVAGQLNAPGYSGDGYLAIYAELLNPTGIAVDGYGNLFIADSGNYVVREVSKATGYISTIAGTPTQQGAPSSETPGVSATSFSLGNPQAVTVDSAGNVYIADGTFYGVLEVVATTQSINELPTVLGIPSGLAVDASDALYFTLPAACGVFKFPAGASLPIPLAGSGSCTPGGDGGSALLAGLNNPKDVVVDGTGSLYILENDGVRFVDSTGTQPTTIAFGSQQIFTTSAPGSVLLFNGDVATPAGGTANPLGVYYSGGLALPFAIAAPATGADCSQATTSVPIPLNPAAFCALDVTFSPVTDSPFNTSTSLSEGNPATSTQTINFTGTGTGTGPTATLMPSMQGIAAGVDGGSASATFTLTNTGGGATLTITSIGFANTAVSGFTYSTNCGSQLAQNANCTITVSYAPTAAAAVAQTLVVTDNTASGQTTAAISGTGVLPTATLTPPSLNFNSVVNEGAATTQTFTLTNTGTQGYLQVSDIEFTTQNGFNVAYTTATTCYGGPVAPGGTCTIAVSFNPSATGMVSNTITVTDNTAAGSQTATVNGTATAPIATLSTTSVSFTGNTPVGSQSTVQTITLSNTGTATLKITGIVLTGLDPSDFVMDTSACGTTLAVSANCNINVYFKPMMPGSFSAQVAITDDSGGHPAYLDPTQTVTLNGSSSLPAQTSSFTIADTAFPATPVGVAESQNVLLTLKSTSTVLQSISAAPGFTEYVVNSITGCTVDGSTANASGTVCMINVSFTPATPGSQHNTPLIVTTIENSIAVPYYFALTAQSTGVLAALTPGIIGPYVASDGSFGASAGAVGGMGGPATAASTGFFSGIAIDSANNMYVSDSGYALIYKINPQGIISIYAGTPFNYGGYLQTISGDGGLATAATLSNPGRLALDAVGNLYVDDADNFFHTSLRKIDAASKVITTVIGTNTPCAAKTDAYGDGCPGNQVAYSGTNGLTVGPDGNVYFSSGDGVHAYNPTTGMVTLYAGSGGTSEGTGADGGNALGAAIIPSALAFDSSGDLFVIDNNVHVRKITTGGIISTVAGAPGSTPLPGSTSFLPCTTQIYNSASNHSSGNGGPATAAKFCYLTGIAVDAANNIYLNDFSASEIRRIDSGTGTIVEVSGANSVQNEDFGDYNEVLGNNDGSARDASLRYPEYIALDGSANIYIMEYEGEVRWINVSQSALDFTPSINPNPPYNREAVNIGTLTGPQQVTVVNAGNSGNITFSDPLTTPPLFGISTADYTRDTGAADCLSTNTGMAPGNECPINIDFTPTVAGTPILDTNTVSSNAGAQSISLIGYASGAAQLSLLPALQIFEGNPNTAIGPQTFTLMNNTAYSLASLAISFTGPNATLFSQTNNCGSSLAANSSCTISVSFQSPTAGQFLAQLNVAYSQNYGYGSFPGSLTSNLIGLAGAPEGKFSTVIVAGNPSLFGNVEVGATSTHSFQFVSTGNIALNISSVAITGTNASQFSIASNNCPALLQPSAECTITVTFAPTAIASYSASLIVNDNAADSPQSAALSGSGLGYYLPVNEVVHITDAPVETPSTLLPVNEVVHITDTPVDTPSTLLPVNETIHVSDQISGTGIPAVIFLPTALGFGYVALSTSQQLSLQIINSTSSGLSLSAFSLTGSSEFSLHSGTCPSIIAAGNSCVLQVQFVPTATGSASGMVTVAGSSTTVPVSGSGAAVLTVTPQSTSRNFGTANPAFTYAVTGFVNGDTSAVLTGAPSLSTTATLNSPAGVYPITATGGTLAAPSTYIFSFASGSLTVNGGAAQTIAFTLPSSVSISHPQLTLTAHSTSGLAVRYAVTGPASVTGSTLTFTGTGTVMVTASQSGNATFTPATNVVQSFTVTP